MLWATFGRTGAAIPIYPYQPINWQWILSLDGQDEIGANTRAGVLPHDASSYRQLTQFYRGLAAANSDISTVVVIGPNHYEKGEANVQTALRPFRTVDGVLAADLDLAEQMQLDGVGKIDSGTFVKEHAMTMQVEYIKRFFPQAKLLAIVLKSETTPEEADKLASWLATALPADKTLVLGSIDFSHYLNKAQADKNDAKTLRQIQTMDVGALPTSDVKCEFLDSPMALRVIVQYALAVGAGKPVVVRHDNTTDIFDKPDLASTTSHYYITWGGV